MNLKNIENAKLAFDKARKDLQNELYKGFEEGFKKLDSLILKLVNIDKEFLYEYKGNYIYEIDFPKINEKNHSDYYPTYYLLSCNVEYDYDEECFNQVNWEVVEYNGGEKSGSESFYLSDYDLTETKMSIENILSEIKFIEDKLKEIDIKNKMNSLKDEYINTKELYEKELYEKELYRIYNEKFNKLKEIVLELANLDKEEDYISRLGYAEKNCFSMLSELPLFYIDEDTYTEKRCTLIYHIYKDLDLNIFNNVKIIVNDDDFNSTPYKQLSIEDIDLISFSEYISIDSIEYEIEETKNLICKIKEYSNELL